MIYTARYANRRLIDPRYVKVGITVGNPKFRLGYGIDGYLRSLAPYAVLDHDEKLVFDEIECYHPERGWVKSFLRICNDFRLTKRPMGKRRMYSIMGEIPGRVGQEILHRELWSLEQYLNE